MCNKSNSKSQKLSPMMKMTENITKCIQFSMGRDMIKGVFGANTNNKDPDQPAEINSLIRNFAILRYVPQYPMIL